MSPSGRVRAIPVVTLGRRYARPEVTATPSGLRALSRAPKPTVSHREGRRNTPMSATVDGR